VIFLISFFLLSVNNKIARSDVEGLSRGTSPLCATPPDTINVQLKGDWINTEWPPNTNQFQMNVPFEDYVWGVIMGELDAAVPEGPYAHQPWSDQVLQAKSVVARTWGSYWCTKHLLQNGAWGVDDTPNDQVYRPYRFGGTTKLHFIDVSKSMQGIYIAYQGLLSQSPYKGYLIDAQYRRDPGNPTCSWLSGDLRSGCRDGQGNPVSGYDYLRSVNNPTTILNSGNDGPGWAQTPSQGWAKANTQTASWYQTLVYYYTGVSMMNKEPTFSAKYWNNKDCSGTQAITPLTTSSINYDWGTGSPASGVSADNFCVEWSNGGVNFPFTDWYTFFVLADDGIQLYYDNQLISNYWQDQAPTWHSVSLPVTAGNHNIRLRYYDHTGGAVARMSWTRGRGMLGVYYGGVIPKTGAITIPQIILRPEASIQFDWNQSSPLDSRESASYPSIPVDNFSARWEGDVYVPGCNYVTFTTLSDDGIYLYRKSDGYPIIDIWGTHPPTAKQNTMWLCGTTQLRARYREDSGGAVINIAWQ
jgi:hypothetical protein